MELNDLLAQGAQLAVLGMSTVFIILTLLIFGVRCMARLVPAELNKTNIGPQTASSSILPDDHRMAIEQAIAQHRAKKV